MSLSQIIIIQIVSRSYFQATCSEFHVYVVIKDDRNFTIYQRNDSFFTVKMSVAFIIRIDTNRSIAQNSFRTSSCNSYIFIGVNDLVSNVIEFGINFLMNYFFVTERCFRSRIPVDHSGSTIDLPFVKKIDKSINHTFRIFLIHSESSAIPITTGA